MDTGREKIEPEKTISVEEEIQVKGITYTKEPEGPQGGMIEVAHKSIVKLKVVLTGITYEFYEGDKLINRFEIKGKTKDRVINGLVTVLKDICAFDKPKDARRWIVKERIFEILTNLKEKLIEQQRIKKEQKLEEQVNKDYSFDKNIPKQVLGLLLKDKKDEATEILVRKILEEHTIKTTRNDKQAEMYIYREGIYYPEAKTYIEEHCRNNLGEGYSLNVANQVISKIQTDTFIEQEEFFKEEDVNLIPLQNGIFNIQQKKLIPFSPEYRFFGKIPINYNPNQECPKIEEFFTELFRDNSEVKVIQELFGYLLYREYFIEKAIMFLGFGRNGKGKTLDLMRRFIGIDNCAEIPLDEMEIDLYCVSELFKKHANLCGDLSKTALTNTGRFKKLTGRDLLTVARKNKTRIKFENYAKMIFSANELPLTHDVTTAFFGRWIILDFPFTFLQADEKEKLELNGEDTSDIKDRDPHIIDKISSDEEMTGLFNWAIEGLERLLKNKTFSYSSTTKGIKKKWQRRSDSCLAFCMDCVEENPEGYIIKKDFKMEYATYCRTHKLPISKEDRIKEILTTFRGAIDDREYVNVKTGVNYEGKDMTENKQVRVWAGVQLKNEEKNED